MDFVRRRLSQGGSSDDEGKSLSSSFSEGTSRFFTSMVAKKNGLINNLSSKLENVMKTSSSPEDSDSESVSPAQTPSSNYSSYSNGSRNFRGDDFSTQPYRSKKKTERIGIPRRQSSSGYSDSSGNDEVAAGNISFDEPLYSPTSKSTFTYDSKGEHLLKSNCVGLKKVNNEDQAKMQNISHNTYESESKSKIKPDLLKTDSREDIPEDKSKEEKDNDSEEDRKSKVFPVEKSEKETNIDVVNGYKKAPKINRRSSTVDEMLFDDYVPPEEPDEYDENLGENGDVNSNSKRKTLIPMGDLMSFDDDPEKETVNRQKVPIGDEKFSSFTSVSSIDSSEYSVGNNQNGNESTSESEFGGFPVKRSYSMGSENSWSSSYSIDSQPDERTLECMEFMKAFVDQIFDPSKEISQMDKAKFGEFCQEVAGRQWFARYVNGQRVHNKRVTEQIFFQLVQYFAVVLFECGEAEDFTPAKSLMNMCFTFYYEGCHGKNFLYSYLRDQPIWQSLRFWNAAFFDAVQLERSKRPVCTSDEGDDQQKDDRQFQENITFGQLGTFTCNMRAFGLSKELCIEFLRKQSIIANLKREQVQMLKDNVDKWREA
ncbi:uncharacterized protein LOC133205890 [Saccostrea echinata]|uniref:uncharacterized protein LOC133205890 n=1 Tax=Saccostrea echinata TaxID=191078 RepID=UPI002A7F87AD|nr:uncharacterized protein LOC133205890 [Saccostrea echinata]